MPNSRARSLRVNFPAGDAASASNTAAARVTAGAGEALPKPSEERGVRESAMILLQSARQCVVQVHAFIPLNTTHHNGWGVRYVGLCDTPAKNFADYFRDIFCFRKFTVYSFQTLHRGIPQ
jgi:hypothetical protein